MMQKKTAYVCLCAKNFSHVCAVVQKNCSMCLHICKKNFACGCVHAKKVRTWSHACKLFLHVFACMQKKLCTGGTTCEKSLHACKHMQKKFACIAPRANFFACGCMHVNFFACGCIHANFFCVWSHACKIFLRTCKLMRNFSA